METVQDVFALETEEIFADDAERLEELVSIRESHGWTRQGEPATVAPPDEKGGDEVKWVQVVMKDAEGEIPPQE